MIVLTITSAVVLFTYIITFCIKYGIPSSISDSYYSLRWGPLFTLILWICGFLILPGCMEMAQTANTQIIPFLGVGGLLLVGAAPRVRDYERQTHLVGAITCGVCSQLWVILYGSLISMVLWLIPITIVIVKTMRNKKLNNITFWAEVVCFTTMYLSQLQYQYYGK